ncbi:MAG: hypothetical protein COA79_03765 [Planctomycetota bacterium]|nr:MAG: hypothetical protein COA79_03765 [Planctomycetota bacterium]
MSKSLTFLHGNSFPKCTAKVFKYFEGYCSFQLMREGGVDLYYDHEEWLMEGVWIFPSCPGPLIKYHTSDNYSSWNHSYVAICGPQLNEWMALGLFPQRPQKIKNIKEICERFDRMLNFFVDSSKWRIQRAINELEGILYLLAEERDTQVQAPKWLSDLLNMIDENNHLDIDELAEEASMGVSTLRRKFKLATGVALNNYIIEQRIGRAQKDLLENNETIASIAEGLGYSDLYFFSRQFKQIVGIPPAEYRKTK